MAESCVPTSQIRSARQRWAFGSAFAALFLAGCVTGDPSQPGPVAAPRPSSGDVLKEVREIDLAARFPKRTDGSITVAREPTAQGVSYFGEATTPTIGAQQKLPTAGEDPATTGALPSGTGATPTAEGFELNFENTP